MFPIAADDLEEGQVLPRNASNNWSNESVSLTESLPFGGEPALEGNTPDWQKSGGWSRKRQEKKLNTSVERYLGGKKVT